METNIINFISSISLNNSIISEDFKVNSFDFNFMSKVIFITSKKFIVNTKNDVIEQSDSYYHNKTLSSMEDHYYIIKIKLSDYMSEDNFKKLFIDYSIDWKNNEKVFDFFVNFYKDFITIKAANLIEESELILNNREIILQDYSLCFSKK